MLCQNHPEKNTENTCKQCQAALCETCLPSGDICVKCTALAAGSQLADDVVKDKVEEVTREEARKKARKKQKKSILAFKILIIIAAFGVVIYQMPEIINTMKEEQPVRIGTYATDAETDKCIKYLWQVARNLQAGNLPVSGDSCPGSSQPFMVVSEGDDVIVSVSDPHTFGFKTLKVSKRQPVPEIIP